MYKYFMNTDLSVYMFEKDFDTNPNLNQGDTTRMCIHGTSKDAVSQGK